MDVSSLQKRIWIFELKLEDNQIETAADSANKQSVIEDLREKIRSLEYDRREVFAAAADWNQGEIFRASEKELLQEIRDLEADNVKFREALDRMIHWRTRY